ncbi:hypothetical protein ASC77_12960 [Nocardioides sp. Root1257]|uniref:hypothetical protein n=1 Tax=unclassified Nocardioides TaxID=2615069 RepID=UPI0006F67973|nr:MULTISPECIES: hypothetical protein [unclassified Nocardioides]KQW47372.1 hypothetical protein ASC77_12960 [Nocardioides sp. Root1257]KRC45528.1 hypothetical protein ASE24_12965 [Nocardioides sp. Root224]
MSRLRRVAICVGSAHWVRVATSVMVEDVASTTATSWYDDPLAGPHLRIHDSVADRHFGPTLFRGVA